MQYTIKDLKQEPNLIVLRPNEFVSVNNVKLPNLLCITWTSGFEHLVINRVGQDMEEFMKPFVIIQDEHYLLLEEEDISYSRGLVMKVDLTSIRLLVEEILPPILSNGKFKIINEH